MRARLNVDAVLSKILAFAILAAFIAAVYVAIVVGVGSALGSGGDPNAGLSLTATAVVAIAFHPVRLRVQRLTNRLVYGRRATPYEVMSDFTQKMASVPSTDEVLPRTAEAAAEAVGAIRSRVSLFLPAGGTRMVSWPAGEDDVAFEASIAILHGGDVIGDLSVAKAAGDPITPIDEGLLTDLAAQAGVALHNARLTAELNARLEEISTAAADLRASRRRIISAQDIERRRLEREIRSGPEARLAGLSERVEDVENLMSSDPERAVALMDELITEANHTLEALRDIARGVFPPLLIDRGLVPALEAHVRKSGLDVDVDVVDDLRDRRFDESIEACLYFCCVMALQNVAEHAGGAPAEIRLRELPEWVEFSVIDRGPGFDPALTPPGVHLQGIGDRLNALGGRLEVTSEAGRGTTVSGRVPIVGADGQDAAAHA